MGRPRKEGRTSHTVRMPEATYKAAVEAANRTGATINDVMSEAMARGLNQAGPVAVARAEPPADMVAVSPEVMAAAVQAAGEADAAAWVRERIRLGMRADMALDTALRLDAAGTLALPAADAPMPHRSKVSRSFGGGHKVAVPAPVLEHLDASAGSYIRWDLNADRVAIVRVME